MSPPERDDCKTLSQVATPSLGLFILNKVGLLRFNEGVGLRSKSDLICHYGSEMAAQKPLGGHLLFIPTFNNANQFQHHRVHLHGTV